MSLDRIAFCGYSRTGKDTVAEPLIAMGYQKVAFANLIKHDAQYLSCDDAMALCRWVYDETAKVKGKQSAEARAQSVMLGYVAIAVCTDYDDVDYYKIDPFTEDTYNKKIIRPFLEEFGMWRYNEFLSRFMAALPSRCINTKLVRVPEAEAWVKEGGVIWQIVRPGVAAATEWEEERLQELRATGLVTATIYNDGTTSHLYDVVRQSVMSLAGLRLCVGVNASS